MENTKNNSINSIIIGISIIVCTIIFSVVFYSSRYSSDSLTVTGSASMQVVSDNAKFTGEFTRIAKVSVLGTGYSQIASDLTKVKSFLKTQGIDDKDITISTVSMYENYNYDKNYQTEKEYILRQQVEISSKDIDKITSLAQSAQQLINQGVIFSVNPVEYYYSKLPEVRVNLLSDAIKDAMARANKMAESTGKKVGNLKSASSGVVQVLPSNSLEISDYGTYDTSKINKNIMVTVKASFGMK
ncbi:MAG: SIMPL domain-containing protein [Candidatus Pacebacteria bacterium]|nr:SIMPL domain-containing protein [Candidatus Paceibacterota bacterium]